MSFSSIATRYACLVELSAGGLVGLGESWVNYPAWGYVERTATLLNGVAPLLLATEVSDPRVVHRRLVDALSPVGRQWGAPGPIWQAISGVDLALWDLLGKATSRSAADLLGGTSRMSIPVYASGVGPDRVHELTEVACSAGFEALKVKVGFGRERDAQTLAGARRVAGSALRIFADANQAWTVDEAMEMCALLADFGAEWCEEPVVDNRLTDLETLYARTTMPIATGENVYTTESFARYSSSDAVHVLQPDVAKSGGLTTVHEVVSAATTHRTPVSPHCYSSAVTLAASLQLAAAHENVEWVELDVRPNRLRTELAKAPFVVSSGRLEVPRGHGRGVELDDAIVSATTILQKDAP
jgi:L-alanine-DL-glutamate epimerase-like enolase superfamily enzyme